MERDDDALDGSADRQPCRCRRRASTEPSRRGAQGLQCGGHRQRRRCFALRYRIDGRERAYHDRQPSEPGPRPRRASRLSRCAAWSTPAGSACARDAPRRAAGERLRARAQGVHGPRPAQGRPGAARPPRSNTATACRRWPPRCTAGRWRDPARRHHEVIRGIARERGATTAARTRGALGRLFSWAIASGYIEANPTIGTESFATGRRDRVLATASCASSGRPPQRPARSTRSCASWCDWLPAN